MLTTSTAFDTAIADNVRKINARVTINYTDIFLDPTVDIEAHGTDYLLEDASNIIITEDDLEFKSEGNNIASRTDQASNGRDEATYKWLSLEPTGFKNEFLLEDESDQIITEDAADFIQTEVDVPIPLNTLDGTWHLMPGTAEEATYNEVGWWGDHPSTGTNVVEGGQGLNLEFSARSVTSFKVVGDNQRSEYPVDFTVAFYAGASLQGTETITNNTLVTYEQDITALNNITMVELQITEWSHPYRVCKILEMSTGVYETYNADDISRLGVVEQREISNDNTVPTGNIASNEAEIALINKNRRFDANNTSSRLYGLVKPNNRVLIEMGVLTSSGGFEYVPVFTGWALGWDVPENDIVASVPARDRLNLLEQTKITTQSVVAGDSFKDWFTTVLNDAGLAVTEYEIDPVLDGTIYNVPYGWFNDVSHREALKILSESCGAAVFVDRAGLIQVRAIDYFEANELDSLVTFNRSQYMDKTNQPIYENITNKISVTTNPLVLTTSQTVYQTTTNDPESINANSIAEYAIKYNTSPISAGVATVDPAVSGVTVTDYTLYAWGGTVEVTNTNGTSQNFRIKVVGTTYTVDGQKTETALDQTSIDNNGEFFLSFPGNAFLQTTQMAGKIANTLLSSFKDPQRDLTVNFEPGGNPALELDDRISIVDLYQTKEYNIVSQNISYDGGLSMQLTGRFTTTEILLTETGENLITEDNLFIVID